MRVWPDRSCIIAWTLKHEQNGPEISKTAQPKIYNSSNPGWVYLVIGWLSVWYVCVVSDWRGEQSCVNTSTASGAITDCQQRHSVVPADVPQLCQQTLRRPVRRLWPGGKSPQTMYFCLESSKHYHGLLQSIRYYSKLLRDCMQNTVLAMRILCASSFVI